MRSDCDIQNFNIKTLNIGMIIIGIWDLFIFAARRSVLCALYTYTNSRQTKDTSYLIPQLTIECNEMK